jgi:hypothetical protein
MSDNQVLLLHGRCRVSRHISSRSDISHLFVPAAGRLLPSAAGFSVLQRRAFSSGDDMPLPQESVDD